MKKEQCDANPRKFANRLPSCELSFKWMPTETKPQRVIDKITLNGPGSDSEVLYSVDVSVDPSNFNACEHNLDIQICLGSFCHWLQNGKILDVCWVFQQEG